MSPALPALAAFPPRPGSHQALMQPCQHPAGPDSQPRDSTVQEPDICPPPLPPCPGTRHVQPRGGSSRAAPASFHPRAQRGAQQAPALCPAPGASQISHPKLPRSSQAERAPCAPSKPTCVRDDSHDLGTRSMKQGNLLCRDPSLRHTSRDEMLQLAVTRGDKNTGTKSRGLFSTWANAFEHLHCLVIKRSLWQKQDV